jgi:type IV pilus assembly protein PilA
MKRMQKGFTLIELMIVVAIIGILAAVAIPQYQDYTVKAKLSKVQTWADPIKTAMGVYAQENGSYPATASAWASLGIAAAGPSYTTEVAAATITANTGDIVMTLGTGIRTGIDGGALTMTPSAVAAGATQLTWTNTCAAMTDVIFKKYFAC